MHQRRIEQRKYRRRSVRQSIIPLVLTLLLTASFVDSEPVSIETIVDDVVAKHMVEKQIPGLSVAVVSDQQLVFSKGYGQASIEFDIDAAADTVYPISSVTRVFAGALAMRLVEAGLLDLDHSIADYLDDVPADKKAISVRHLLQHTHGLEDFYHSETFRKEYGKPPGETNTAELVGWSLNRPFVSAPGDVWAYGVVGYVVLAQVIETVGGDSYARLVQDYVFDALDMDATYGGSTVVVPGRNPILYELIDDEVTGHVVDFPERVWAAGGLNISVIELAKLFIALSGDDFLDQEAKQSMWRNEDLPDGENTHYGLGWMSYITSQDRWVVGHEGGGASWVIYYPEEDLAVIALSNMSGARADVLPYEIARAIFQ
jgi:CubicO group peptidase (beta-lactamase class C family)